MSVPTALTEGVYYILLSLIEPLHGYGIMQHVEALTDGRVRLAAGTLYGAISAMLEKGWISALPGDGRKKEYQITALGRKILDQEIARLKELLSNGNRILGGTTEHENSKILLDMGFRQRRSMVKSNGSKGACLS